MSVLKMSDTVFVKSKAGPLLLENGTGYYAVQIASYAVPVAFALIFLTSIVANGLALYAVCHRKRTRNVPNAFIVNIVITNLLLVLVCAPLKAVFYIYSTWVFGEGICQMVESLETVFLASLVFSVVGLSIERYSAFTCPPRKRRYAKNRAVCALLIIWCLASAAGVSDFYTAAVDILETKGPVFNEATGNRLLTQLRLCSSFGRTIPPIYGKVYISMKLALLFAIPLVIVLSFYSSLACVICYKKQIERRKMGCGRATLVGTKSKDAPTESGGDSSSGTRNDLTGTLLKTMAAGSKGKTATLMHAGGTLRRAGTGVRKRRTLSKVAIFLQFQTIIFWSPLLAHQVWFHLLPVQTASNTPMQTLATYPLPTELLANMTTPMSIPIVTPPLASTESPKTTSFATDNNETLWYLLGLIGICATYANAALAPVTIILFSQSFRDPLCSPAAACCCWCCCPGDNEDDMNVGERDPTCCDTPPCCFCFRQDRPDSSYVEDGDDVEIDFPPRKDNNETDDHDGYNEGLRSPYPDSPQDGGAYESTTGFYDVTTPYGYPNGRAGVPYGGDNSTYAEIRYAAENAAADYSPMAHHRHQNPDFIPIDRAYNGRGDGQAVDNDVVQPPGVYV